MAERIVVVGGGSMGAGIAAVASSAGYDVTLVEPDQAARTRAAQRAPEATLLAEVPHDDAVSLAIEAVPERIDLKRAVFAALADALPNAVLATNTSSLSVAAIGVAAPSRTVGLHFFNPPEKMRLVEVVRTQASGSRAVAVARAFVETIGRTGITTADTPGFVVNRVARPFYLQALRALEAEIASVEALDALARSAGFPMGPFELMDFIGLDVNLATSESIYERTGVPRFEPSNVQRALVAQGRLGRKSGRGFYSYDARPPRIDLRTEPSREGSGERVAVLGTGTLAQDLAAAFGERVAIESQPTIVIEAGDGERDSADSVARLDTTLPRGCLVLADAYATVIAECATRMQHPQRFAGFGVVGRLEDQSAIELVASPRSSEETLARATRLFEAAGYGVVRIADAPGLFLGRTIASIVNEATIAVNEGVASADDVDAAMRLGTNYPKGPIAWGRVIGEGRVARILERLAFTDTKA